MLASVRFNEDAQVLQAVVPLGSGGLSDLNRGTTKDIINGSGLAPAAKLLSAMASFKAAMY